jgi:hypothetical protein
MKWIATEDQLPKPGQKVIRYGIAWNNEIYDVGEMVTKDGLRWADFGVTHWMPLPEPPNQKRIEWFLIIHFIDGTRSKRFQCTTMEKCKRLAKEWHRPAMNRFVIEDSNGVRYQSTMFNSCWRLRWIWEEESLHREHKAKEK